jgi:hypothetical protein
MLDYVTMSFFLFYLIESENDAHMVHIRNQREELYGKSPAPPQPSPVASSIQ